MKHFLLSAAVVAAISSAAFAQTAPAPTTPAPTTPPAAAPAPATPAPAARPAVNAAPLENGANSFTEDQAMARLRDAGITDITGLAKDNNGIWRGRGQWQGKAVAVGLDFRGNISAQ